MGRIGAIILAAGSGSRMKSSVKKQFMELRGKPLIAYALETFAGCADDLVLVTGPEDVEYCRSEIVPACGGGRVRAVVPGGSERWNSVQEGLRALRELGYGTGPSDSGEDLVLIQDGARPLTDAGIIRRCLADAAAFGSGVAAMPSKDTIKLADGDAFARETPDRKSCYIIQTPQTFRFGLIFDAYERVSADPRLSEGLTDDAMVLERCGGRVKLSEGSYRNIKVTTPEDMVIAGALLGAAKGRKA